MNFLAPLWLFALLPWAGAVLWLLWGRRRKTPVAFLDLWRGPALQKPAKRALQPPPLFLGFAIFAILAALLAGARPRLLLARKGPERPITLIIDRGMSMSAMHAGAPRFKDTARRAGERLASALSPSTPVELFAIPGDRISTTDLSSCVKEIDALTPTAIDTRAMLEGTVRDHLAAGDKAVVVVSDQHLSITDARLIQFSPTETIDNVGIIDVSARETPSPQVMVRILNDSHRKSVAVKVVSGDESAMQTVDLPPRGQARDYFFDLPRLAAHIETSLDVKDDQSADDRTWLIREGSYPKIEVRAPISAALRRMIDVYTHSRPPGDGSQTVPVVTNESDLPSDAPAVWIAPAAGPGLSGVVTPAAGAVTADVKWSSLSKEIQINPDPPRGWTPLVTIDGHVIVASRAEPVRKVWVGFDAPTWSSTPDFVIFWANVFNWTGRGQEHFAGYPLAKFEPGWKPIEPRSGPLSPMAGRWPGLYQTDEGILRAYNSPALAQGAVAVDTADWHEKIIAAEGMDRAGYNLSPMLLLVALFGLIGASLTWNRPGLTPVWAGRTF